MVENQAYLFIVFSLTGIELGILFDFFRTLRKTFKTSDFVTYIEDIIYWILAGIIVLYNIWFFNDGEIRIYMILGILIGTIIYTLTLSSIFIKINYFVMSKIKIILTFIFKIFKNSLKFINNIVNKLKKLIKFKDKKGKFESNGE